MTKDQISLDELFPVPATIVPCWDIISNAGLEKSGSNPIAPLTTVLYNKLTNLYELRIMSFERVNQTVYPKLMVDGKGVNYYVVYEAKSQDDPDGDYNGWYIVAKDLLCFSQQITVYNYNEDPKTSRGTVTIVQQLII